MNLSKYHCLLIDLDDTLYSQSNGVWEMIRIRINRFMIEELGFPPEEVPELRHRLWQDYGTTLRGLQTEFSVDMDAFLDYVHDVPLETVLKPDRALNGLFNKFPQRKVIFTNAHAAHAQRVIELLSVDHHFKTIIDIYAVFPHCKPEIEAFNKALTLIDEAPESCLLIDDSPKNLITAQSLGMGTISIGTHRHKCSPHIESILELAEWVKL